MKIIRNTGTERVIDLIRSALPPGTQIDLVTPTLSLFAFAEVHNELAAVSSARLVLPGEDADLAFLGVDSDRAARNRLQGRWLAKRLAAWVHDKAEVRRARGAVPQGAVVLRDNVAQPHHVILGAFSFSTDGFGIAPGNPLSLIHASETPEEARALSQWFDMQWANLQTDPRAKLGLLEGLQSLANHRAPSSVYPLILHHLFRDRGEALDEEQVVNSATGIRTTVV
jgi:hypothetical protein